MLPDFPTIKKDIRKNINAIMQEVSEKNSVLELVGRMRHYEGDRTNNKSVDGFEDNNPYAEFSSPMEIPVEEIIAKGPAVFLKHGLAVAEDMKKQAEQYMFKFLNAGIDRVGNTVDAKGQPFTAELFLQMLNKIAISFEDDGTPNMPTVVMHPNEQENAKKVMESIENDLQLKARRDEILKKKKEEWDASEGDRKLVD